MEEKDTKKNATQGKGKGKNKKQTMNLNEFVNAGSTQANSGFTAVSARWADVMDDEDEDSGGYGSKKDSVVILPTAPKSIRGPDIDINTVPTQPPFICYLSNLPFEASEDEIRKFFRDLKVLRIDLNREAGSTNRSRGQGTCEFSDRQSLIDAFALNQEPIKNRPVKISLRSYEQDRESYRRERDGGQDDRTAGDWRSGGKSDFKPMGSFAPSNRPYSESSNSYDNRSRDYNNRNSYNRDGNRDGRDRYGGDSSFADGRQNYNSYNRQSNRPERNYNNSMDNTYPNQQSEMNRSDRGEFTRDQMSKSIELTEPRNDEPPRERQRLILDKPTRPRPEQQPPVLPPVHDTHSNRSESESSETARRSFSETERERPVERKRLILKPPSKKENTNPTEVPKPNSSIFGDARPVDTTKRLLEIETQLQEHDKEIEKELSAKLEKQPITESNDDISREHRGGSREFNAKRLSDSGSQTSGGHMDRPNYRDNQERNDRFDDGGYRKQGNRRMNQYSNQSSGNRNYDNNSYNRDGRDSYRSHKYTNNAGNRTMNYNSNDQMIDKRRDFDDQRSNRMNAGNNSRARQGQENFQQINKFSLLNDEMA